MTSAALLSSLTAVPRPPAPQASSPRRDPALDGLRGFAVLLVFFFHYGGGLRAHNPAVRALGYLSQAGWIGVDLFFALSGFLITGILADSLLVPGPMPGRTLRNFYARRALRILPLYVAALLACAVAALVTGAQVWRLKPLLLYIAFLQNLPPLLHAALRTPAPLPIFHLWSLAVEEQFYLLWPLALLAARTRRRALDLALWTFVASCLFRACIFAPHLFAYSTASSYAVFLPTRAGALALGSALALLPRGSARSLTRRGLLFSLAFAAVAILATALHTHSLLLNSRLGFLVTLPAADVLSAATVALVLHPGVLRQTLSVASLRFVGRVSYGFYVLHILLEPVFDRLGTLLTHSTAGFPYQTARLLTAFPITLLAAILSFYVLERPFLHLKRRFPRDD